MNHLKHTFITTWNSLKEAICIVLFYRQKDGVNLELDVRVRQVSDEFGNIKLMIRDIKPSDAGVYVCIAENDAGSTRCSAALRVTSE